MCVQLKSHPWACSASCPRVYLIVLQEKTSYYKLLHLMSLYIQWSLFFLSETCSSTHIKQWHTPACVRTHTQSHGQANIFIRRNPNIPHLIFIPVCTIESKSYYYSQKKRKKCPFWNWTQKHTQLWILHVHNMETHRRTVSVLPLSHMHTHTHTHSITLCTSCNI